MYIPDLGQISGYNSKMLQFFHEHRKSGVAHGVPFELSGVAVKTNTWSLFPRFVIIPLKRTLSRSSTVEILYESSPGQATQELIYTACRSTCVHSPTEETAHPWVWHSLKIQVSQADAACMPGYPATTPFTALCVQALWSKKPSPTRFESTLYLFPVALCMVRVHTAL